MNWKNRKKELWSHTKIIERLKKVRCATVQMWRFEKFKRLVAAEQKSWLGRKR